MSPYVPENVEAYAERYTTARADLFDRLGEETRATQTAPQMMVGPVEGAFLSFLVTMTNAKRVLEVGTFTGWSSIAMAGALPPGGSIVTCDVNEETTAVARRYPAGETEAPAGARQGRGRGPPPAATRRKPASPIGSSTGSARRWRRSP